MNTTILILGTVMLTAVLCLTGCARKQPPLWQSIKNPDVTAQLKSFVAEKEAQANASTNEIPPGFAAFFASAKNGDWLAVSNAFEDLRKHAPQYEGSGAKDARLTGSRGRP